MTRLEDLGIVNTGGVKIEPFVIWPPELRFHQEGVLDAVVVAYNERETDEVIPIGRVVTVPHLQEMEKYDEEYEAETHEVRGIVGDATIFRRVNDALFTELAKPIMQHDINVMTQRLKAMQDEAGRLVVTYFDLEIPKPGRISRFGSAIRRT